MFVSLRTHKIFPPRDSKIDVYDNGYLPRLSLLYFDASNSKPFCIEFNVLITDIKTNLFLLTKCSIWAESGPIPSLDT